MSNSGPPMNLDPCEAARNATVGLEVLTRLDIFEEFILDNIAHQIADHMRVCQSCYAWVSERFGGYVVN